MQLSVIFLIHSDIKKEQIFNIDTFSDIKKNQFLISDITNWISDIKKNI
jgi:hypothetical protein